MNIYICAKVKYSDRNRDVGMACSLWQFPEAQGEPESQYLVSDKPVNEKK